MKTGNENGRPPSPGPVPYITYVYSCAVALCYWVHTVTKQKNNIAAEPNMDIGRRYSVFFAIRNIVLGRMDGNGMTVQGFPRRPTTDPPSEKRVRNRGP